MWGVVFTACVVLFSFSTSFSWYSHPPTNAPLIHTRPTASICQQMLHALKPAHPFFKNNADGVTTPTGSPGEDTTNRVGQNSVYTPYIWWCPCQEHHIYTVYICGSGQTFLPHKDQQKACMSTVSEQTDHWPHTTPELNHRCECRVRCINTWCQHTIHDCF